MSTPFDDQTPRQGSPAGFSADPPPTAYPSNAYPPQSQYPPTPPAAPAPADTGTHQPAAGFDERGRVRRGRISSTWIALIVVAIGLILLVVFIAQNSKVVPIHFLGFAGHLAVGLTVLIAAVVGLLLAAIPGTIRIVQLRKALKSNVPKDQRAP